MQASDAAISFSCFLKYLQLQGLLVLGTNYDLYQGAPKHYLVDQVDELIQKSTGKIKFSKRCPPQCARFSLDGQMLVTGTKDGFIEVWDYEKCKLRKDLEYQARVSAITNMGRHRGNDSPCFRMSL